MFSITRDDMILFFLFTCFMSFKTILQNKKHMMKHFNF